jgi:hypothetical protein
MHVYISFTEKQQIKIDEWKKSLPVKKGRMFEISFVATGERDVDKHLLFKAYFKSSDGHKLLVTKKAAFH